MSRLVFLSVCISILCLSGCSERGTYIDFLGTDGGTRDAGDRGVVDSSEPAPEVLIYAHSANTLYRFENERVTAIGMFHRTDGQPMRSIKDIAVDQSATIYGVSDSELFRISEGDATATLVGTLDVGNDQMNSLTFVEAGAIDPNNEVLIALTLDGLVFRIDASTGRGMRVGSLPNSWGASGDLVSVAGAGTYATVINNVDCDPSTRVRDACDHLARIEFNSNGSIRTLRDIGIIGNQEFYWSGVFGLGYWGATLYGFTTDGVLLRIRRDNAEATVEVEHTGADRFFGAGVTTRAYVIP